MESLVTGITNEKLSPPAPDVNSKAQAEAMILTFMYEENSPSHDVKISFEELYKSLTIAGQKIIDALNVELKESLPSGIQSLKPEDITSEATADKIVQGATALFNSYAAQNPDMEGEDLLNGFMETIKGGIKKGYEDAMGILGDLGALEYDGVQSGIAKTMQLVDEKLAVYENQMRETLGLSTEIIDNTQNEILKQVGGQILS